MKKWKAPIIVPLAPVNDPLADLAQEEATIRSPQMAPGFMDKPDDERHALMPMLQGIRELAQKKNQAQQPMGSPGPLRDNFGVVPPVPRKGPVMQAPTTTPMPQTAAAPQALPNLQSSIYGTKGGSNILGMGSPDALLNLIAERLKNTRFS